MTRIIGGSAGGRRLRTPKGELTRPTSDRVREALFSAIESALGSLAGLRFLDLYAGSGAVGLEALSRGAAAATLVEQDRRTVELIRANAATVGLPGADVRAGAVARHLTASPSAPYDVVFLDPPYSLANERLLVDLGLLGTHGWLGDGALVVVERSRREVLQDWPEGYEPRRRKQYGETVLSSATWSGSTPGARAADWYGRDHPDAPTSADEVV